jgi:hypothetical protein
MLSLSIALLIPSIVISYWLYQYAGESISLLILSVYMCMHGEINGQVLVLFILMAYACTRYMHR